MGSSDEEEDDDDIEVDVGDHEDEDEDDEEEQEQEDDEEEDNNEDDDGDNEDDNGDNKDNDDDNDSDNDDDNGDDDELTELTITNPDPVDVVDRSAKVLRIPGPTETILIIGTDSYKLGKQEWETADGWRYKREVKEEEMILEKEEEANGGKKKPKKGSTKKKASGKKKSGKKKSGKKGKGAKASEPPELPELTMEEMLEKEKESTALAAQHLSMAITMYLRVVNICLDSQEKEDHELYIPACVNIGESHMLLGNDVDSQVWVGKAIQMIDTPFRVSGAMRVMAKEYIVESGRVWWPDLFPEPVKEEKKKKGKKGAKTSKKKGKKKGSKKKSKKSSKKKKKK